MGLLSKIKKLSILSLITITSLNAQLFNGVFGDNYCPGPLCPCSIGVQIKGGVAPTFWTDPSANAVVLPGAFPFVLPLATLDFDDMFDLPWTVGGELTYNLNDHVQVFGEVSYRQADGRSRSRTLGALTLTNDWNEFKAIGGYVGARYFLNRWECLGIAPFVGAKIGAVYHWAVQNRPDVAIDGVILGLGHVNWYHSNTALSAGIQLGFDYEITECLGLVFLVEGVFTDQMKPNHNAVFSDLLGITNGIVGETGTDISVPITLGLRWNF